MEDQRCLSRVEIMLLVNAVQTGNVPTIAETILSVDQLYYFLSYKLQYLPANQISNKASAAPFPSATRTSPEVYPNDDLDPNWTHFQEDLVEHLPCPKHSIEETLTLTTRDHCDYKNFDHEVLDLSIKKINAPKEKLQLDICHFPKDLSVCSKDHCGSTQSNGRAIDLSLKKIHHSTSELQAKLKGRTQLSAASIKPPELDCDLLNPINLATRNKKEQEADHSTSLHPGSRKLPKDTRLQAKPNSVNSKKTSDNLIEATFKNEYPSRRLKKCSLCSKKVRADGFQIHMRVHTGEKPYHCPICPFKTGNPNSMPKHVRIHDRGRQIYECERCPYKTIYKNNLVEHKACH